MTNYPTFAIAFSLVSELLWIRRNSEHDDVCVWGKYYQNGCRRRNSCSGTYLL